MMVRARANQSPHFAFLGYEPLACRVRDLILVPGHFITPEVIEPCKPLSPTARRAGWIGCNILARRIPPDGRLTAIQEGRVMSPEDVREGWRRFADLGRARADERGWAIDVLRCVRVLGSREFTLREFYDRFESELSTLHPDNRNVQPKIRQQLQVLRDRGILRFLGGGRYFAE
jgi:type II restriction enzyme